MKLLVLATASLALLLGARAGKEGGGRADRQGKGMFDIEDLVSSLPTQVGDTADSGDKPADRKRSIDIGDVLYGGPPSLNTGEEDNMKPSIDIGDVLYVGEEDNLKPVETKRA